MFGFKRKTGEIDAQLTIVANSLANNYKDAARDGLKEAKRLFEALKGNCLRESESGSGSR